MTLSKETLNKTSEIIYKEIESLELQVNEIYNSKIRNQSFQNFNVISIDREWSILGKEDILYIVKFKHNKNDVDFNISIKGDFDRISWASYSYSQFKNNEERVHDIKEAKSYIESVHEMLCIFEDTREIKKFVNEIAQVYIEEILPLNNKKYELQKELSNIKDQIREIDEEDNFQKAIELFSETVYFKRYYQYNQNTIFDTFKLIHDSKKDIYYTIYNGRKRTLTKADILSIYRHANKIIYDNKTDFDKKYNAPGYKRYFKTSNVFKSIEEMNNAQWEEITKEEYENKK